MQIEIGKKYYRKNQTKILVRQVLNIKDEIVEYQVIFGDDNRIGKCTIRTFEQWYDFECLNDNYENLEDKTYNLLSCINEAVITLHGSDLRKYNLKPYVKTINNEKFQFIDEEAEKFWLSKKKHNYFGNKQCVVCGLKHKLTRHHVLPKRKLKKLTKEEKDAISDSNILIVCQECHNIYNKIQFTEQEHTLEIWLKHFIDNMKPKFMPGDSL